jgi:hypothetical protein
MTQPNKFTPIIISAAVMTIISIFPLINLINLFCCAGIIAGGFAGAAFYAKQLEKAGSIIQFKDGAAIGAFSGLLAAIIVAAFNVFITMLSSQNPIPEMYKLIDSMNISIPPEADRFMKRISDEYSNSGFSITLTIINLVSNLITYPLFGFVGGIIASSLFDKRRNAG